ncbi:MAG: hypothetical protein ACI4JC_01995, partial [Faecalibacterium sp.]
EPQAAGKLPVRCYRADGRAGTIHRNISKQADYFESERRITVYNARTVKTGPDTYKVNYIYLNDYTMYVVEDISGTHTDPYHYKIYFHTDVLPSVEVRT